MSTRHTYITWVFMHIVNNYRCSIPKHGLQHPNPLHRPKVAKVLLDCRCRTRNSSEIEYLLIDIPVSILACNLWNQEKSGILGSSHLAGSISNHLQQALQIKFGSKRNRNAVQLRQFFCPLSQICYELRTTLINSLSHRIYPQSERQ